MKNFIKKSISVVAASITLIGVLAGFTPAKAAAPAVGWTIGFQNQITGDNTAGIIDSSTVLNNKFKFTYEYWTSGDYYKVSFKGPTSDYVNVGKYTSKSVSINASTFITKDYRRLYDYGSYKIKIEEYKGNACFRSVEYTVTSVKNAAGLLVRDCASYMSLSDKAYHALALTKGTETARYFVTNYYYYDEPCSDAVFVNNLYTRLLRRQPDQGGRDYWLGLLKTKTRKQVVALFITCKPYEFEQYCKRVGLPY